MTSESYYLGFSAVSQIPFSKLRAQGSHYLKLSIGYDGYITSLMLHTRLTWKSQHKLMGNKQPLQPDTYGQRIPRQKIFRILLARESAKMLNHFCELCSTHTRAAQLISTPSEQPDTYPLTFLKIASCRSFSFAELFAAELSSRLVLRAGIHF